MSAAESVHKALNRLAKWRSVLTGWQLGTRASNDPECQAVRDHREVSLILRAEVSTLVALLVKKGVFTVEEFTTALGDEADRCDADLQRRFPGISSTDDGMMFDERAQETMKGWKP